MDSEVIVRYHNVSEEKAAADLSKVTVLEQADSSRGQRAGGVEGLIIKKKKEFVDEDNRVVMAEGWGWAEVGEIIGGISGDGKK